MTALVFFLGAVPVLMAPRLLREQFETPKALLLLATAYALAFAVAPPLDALTLAACAWPVAFAFAVFRSPSWLRGFFGATPSCDGLVHQVAYVVLFLAARSPGLALEELAVPTAAATALVCAYAIIQVAGLDPLVWDRGASLIAGRARPASTLGHANELGAWLAMAAPLVLALDSPGRWPLVGAATFVVAATLSRAAWVAMAAGLATFAALSGAGTDALLGLVPYALGAGLVVVVLPGLRRPAWARLRALVGLQDEQRRLLYRGVWRLCLEHPWTGVGPEHLADALMPDPEAARQAWRPGMLWPVHYTRAHCEPLHVLVTTGIVGTAVAAAFLVLLADAGAARYAVSPEQAAPLIASLVAFAVAVLPGFHRVATMGLAAVCAGMLAS